MNQSKFSLALVINLLTAIAIGYVCFLGANFYTLGDKTKSIILATIITSILIGTSVGAKLLKKTKRNCKICFIWEIVLIISFTVLTACITYFPFSHYFVVSAQKQAIQSKLKDNISQAENMYNEYDTYFTSRYSLYSRNLNDAIDQRKGKPKQFNDYGFDENNGVIFERQMQFKQNTLKGLLYPSNFKKIKTNDSIWLNKARISIDNWEPISLMKIINEVEVNTNKSLIQLINISENKAQNELYPPFKPSNLTFKDVKKYFITIGSPSPFSIMIAIIGYVLMLLSWYITKRDSRCTGALTTADYEVVL